MPFVDSDAVFTREHGSIAAYFAEHGEAAFRQHEAEIIAAELHRGGPKILALGGGAILTSETRERLRSAPVVLLMTTEAAVLETANLSKRPLLKDDPGAWSRILAERQPLYEEVANVTFWTNRLSREHLTRKVAQWVRRYRPPKRSDHQGA